MVCPVSVFEVLWLCKKFCLRNSPSAMKLDGVVERPNAVFYFLVQFVAAAIVLRHTVYSCCRFSLSNFVRSPFSSLQCTVQVSHMSAKRTSKCLFDRHEQLVYKDYGHSLMQMH